MTNYDLSRGKRGENLYTQIRDAKYMLNIADDFVLTYYMPGYGYCASFDTYMPITERLQNKIREALRNEIEILEKEFKEL